MEDNRDTHAIMIEITRRNAQGLKLASRALWTLGDSQREFFAAVKYCKAQDALAWSVEIVRQHPGETPRKWF